MEIDEEDMKALKIMKDFLNDSVVIKDKVLRAALENIDGRLRRIEERLGIPHELVIQT